MQNREQVFYLRERYRTKMYKDIILNEIITFIFYFVFNILFQDHPKYGMIKPFFGFLFAVIAAGVLFFGKKRADRVAATRYVVKSNGLEYHDGKKMSFYPWDHFVEIKRNPNLISMIYPVEFHTKEGKFTLHRQLEKPDELIPLIAEKTNLSSINIGGNSDRKLL